MDGYIYVILFTACTVAALLYTLAVIPREMLQARWLQRPRWFSHTTNEQAACHDAPRTRSSLNMPSLSDRFSDADLGLNDRLSGADLDDMQDRKSSSALYQLLEDAQ